ncbi:MAG: acylphosphatase [Bacteroidia bacterium]
MKTLKFTIKGRVQQVYFRQYTLENAKELGIKGWVKNLPDKSVQCVATGTTEALQEFEKRLWKGSPLSKVENLIVEAIEPTEIFSDFKIV